MPKVIIYDGRKFTNDFEIKCYKMLKVAFEKDVELLDRQKWVITPKIEKTKISKAIQPLTYECDFVIKYGGMTYHIDTKGTKKRFRQVRVMLYKLMLHLHGVRVLYPVESQIIPLILLIKTGRTPEQIEAVLN